MALTKEALLTRTLKTEDVAVSGGTVTVRAITRGEYQHAAGIGQDSNTVDPRRFEKRIVTAGLTDPEMAEHEVADWMAVAPAGEVGDVVDAIMRLSGFRQDAAKSSV